MNGDYYLIADKYDPGPVTIEFCTTTSTEDTSRENIKVAPNPAYEYVEVSRLGSGLKTIQIIDMQGSIHKIEKTIAERLTIDTSNLSGLYFLKIEHEDGSVETERIFIGI